MNKNYTLKHNKTSIINNEKLFIYMLMLLYCTYLWSKKAKVVKILYCYFIFLSVEKLFRFHQPLLKAIFVIWFCFTLCVCKRVFFSQYLFFIISSWIVGRQIAANTMTFYILFSTTFFYIICIRIYRSNCTTYRIKKPK